MLIGQYTHEIDPKKRLTLPAKWRKNLGKKVIVTTGLDDALFVYTEKGWEEIATKLSSVSFANKDSRDFNRIMLANAFDLDIDSQGRVLIPDELKKFAKLDKKVVLVGMYSRLEIWNEDAWKKYSEKSQKEVDKLASKLNEIGVL